MGVTTHQEKACNSGVKTNLHLVVKAWLSTQAWSQEHGTQVH